jgi:hypothetical protein
MLLNEREANYSQPKLELYRLFCSLCATQLYIISVKKLVVKVNTKYICGMLNNPDIQPNTTIKCWIASILLFNFELVHILAQPMDLTARLADQLSQTILPNQRATMKIGLTKHTVRGTPTSAAATTL